MSDPDEFPSTFDEVGALCVFMFAHVFVFVVVWIWTDLKWASGAMVPGFLYAMNLLRKDLKKP